MKSNFLNFISLILLIVLNGSCALPLAILGFNTDDYRSGTYPEEKWDFNTDDKFDYEKYISIIAEDESGEEIYYIYAGEYNRIRLELPEGVYSENVILKTTAGTIERTENDSNLYRLFVKEPGIAIEVTATDSKSEILGYLIMETIAVPLPQAKLKDDDNGTINLEVFKNQGQLQLSNDSGQFLCLCKSFTVIRISKEGKREIIKNSGDAFSEETKVLISKAEMGDIYIFDEIMVSCPGYTADKKSRSLTYIFKP